MKRVVSIAASMAFATVIAAGLALRAATTPTHADLARELRSHVKYVFVIVQENHTFDNYFGTYPGADNLASSEAQSHDEVN